MLRFNTVNTAENRQVYAGNGVAVTFPITNFVFFEATSLQFTLIDANGNKLSKALTTDVTVTGGIQANGAPGTGTATAVTFTPAIGEDFVIERIEPATQDTDYVNNDTFDAETTEARFDRLTMIVQRALDLGKRAIKISPDNENDQELPADVTNKFVAFDASDNLVAVAGTDTAPDVSDRVVTPTGFSSSTTLAGHLSRFVFPEDFGAIGDGITDDSAAFTSALATGKTLFCDGSKTYLIKDVTIGATNIIQARGARFQPAAGAKYIFRMTGFKPSLYDAEIEDASDVLTVATTLSGAEAAGQTVLSVSSVTGLEVGMLATVRMDVQAGHQSIPRWHISPITAVGASDITIERALEAAAASGNAVECSWGAVNVQGANRFQIDGLHGVNTSWGIYMDADVDNGDSENVKGIVANVHLLNVKHVGLFSGRDCADTQYTRLRINGGWSQTDTYTGDGATTNFDTTEPVWRETHLVVENDDVVQTLTTHYTFVDNDTISYVAAPANGVKVELIHSVRGKAGFVMDATGFVNIRGGDQVQQPAVLGCLRGIELHAKELTQFSQTISDTISGEALLIDDACEQLEFTDTILSFCHAPLKVDGNSAILTMAGTLRTKFATLADLVSGAVATNAVEVTSGSRLGIAAAGWADDSDLGISDFDNVTLHGALILHWGSVNTVAAGSTVYFGPADQTSVNGAAAFVIPGRYRAILSMAQSGATPGGSDTFTYTVRDGGVATALTHITGNPDTASQDVDATGVLFVRSDRLDVELVTSATAAVTRHRGVVALIPGG